MSDKQKELAAKHGTPAEFEEAVWQACDQLFVTTDEATAAIEAYKREWADSEEEDSDR